MKRFCGLCLLAVTLTASLLAAEIIQIPLSGAFGSYSYGNSTRNISLDLKTIFSTIDQAWIKVAGRVVPGLAIGDGIEGPAGPTLVETDFTFRLDTDPTVSGPDWVTSVGGSRFYVEKTLVPSYGSPSWDFLLDGQGDLKVSLFIPDIMIGGYIVRFPYGNIFQASLFVEGEIIESELSNVSVWPQPGDADNDGKVDVGDLALLAGNYGKYDGFCDGEELIDCVTFEQGDFNYDGKIDVGDLGILAGNYGYGVSGASVPEPLSLLFLTLGGVFLSRRK
jgi:hypothetical protein